MPAQQSGDLLGVDAVVLGFGAVDGTHVERMSEEKGDVLRGAEIGEPNTS